MRGFLEYLTTTEAQYRRKLWRFLYVALVLPEVLKSWPYNGNLWSLISGSVIVQWSRAADGFRRM
jgi:hypothetical protein